MAMNCPDDALYKPLARALKAKGTAAGAFFINLIENGPDADLLDAERNHALIQFARRQAFLQSKSRKIVREGSGPVQDPPEETAEAYVERRLHAFRVRLAYRALEGLRLLDSLSSRAYLVRKAGEKQFPLRQIAEEFVKSLSAEIALPPNCRKSRRPNAIPWG